MNNSPAKEVIDTTEKKDNQHQFMVFVAGSILIAFVMVVVAMKAYGDSGASQVDLSRPAYESIRAQATKDRTDIEFSSLGPLDSSAYDQFEKIYTERAKKITTVDSFSADALDQESRRLIGPSGQPEQ